MNIGFVLSHMGASQLGYELLHSVNDYLEKEHKRDINVFYQNVTRSWMVPAFSMMNMSEAYDYRGCLIATSLDTARQIRRFPGAKLRLFYAWDMEWLRYPDYTFEEMAEVYHGDMPIIVRSDDHAHLLRRCWGREGAPVVEQFNIPEFIKVIDGYTKSKK